MEAATLSRTPPRSGPVQVGLVASLLVVAAGAWAATGDRMDGMDAGPGTELGGLGSFAVVWVTMMAAMMLPVDRPDGPRARAVQIVALSRLSSSATQPSPFAGRLPVTRPPPSRNQSSRSPQAPTAMRHPSFNAHLLRAPGGPAQHQYRRATDL
jgi:hypothetical protein